MQHRMTPRDAREAIDRKLSDALQVSPRSASNEQLYKACALVLRDLMSARRRAFTAERRSLASKQVYYLSMEFLMGRSLRNSLYNLGLTEVFEEALGEFDTSLEHLYDCEPDPGLGNGGLGRLAACYLDGLATTGYGGTGYCILFEYGIFRQKISDGWQSELPDYWLPGGDVWLEAVPEHAVEVRFGGEIKERWDGAYHMVRHENYTTVLAMPYNMYVSGYDTPAVSMLRLWQAKSPGIDMDLFNRGDYLGAFGKNSYAETISKVLYPNDNHSEGKLLRLRQQYFLVCASVADILRRHMSVYGTVENLTEKAAIHINDTHPALAIPEMLRTLMDDYGYGWEKSWDMVSRLFAYTNHTVMAEALETWDLSMMDALLPRIAQILREIDRRWREELRERYHVGYDQESRMGLIQDGKVHMANLCVICCHSVNGVSTLHSQLIRETIFHDFYQLTPAKFQNVTNGIASRRWLMQANPLLGDLIKDLIGDGFLHDFSQLARLGEYADDPLVLTRLGEIKRENKARLADHLLAERDIRLDPDTLFDVTAKRLHEYKRQHLNALHILWQYLQIKKDPGAPFQPKTYLFGAKAAPGYYLAKQIIKFICDLAKLIDGDPDVRGRLKVAFLEEYNVTMSEWLLPAAEVSEQISLAGTEASGTGNMKLMLGGAVTLGTMDGANVEIYQQVGADNMFLFGMGTQEAEALRARGYHPREIYEQSGYAREVLDFMLRQKDAIPSFGAIAQYLLDTDRYMALADLDSYIEVQARASALYRDDNPAWQRMSLCNIAGSGVFCADRAIRDYAREIWGL